MFEFDDVRWNYGGALAGLAGIEKVQHRKMLHGKVSVHSFQAQAALTIKEVGDMRLLEAGLLSQPQTGKTALVDPLPKGFAKVVLQNAEFHRLASIRLEL